jgi:hypothetical protein
MEMEKGSSPGNCRSNCNAWKCYTSNAAIQRRTTTAHLCCLGRHDAAADLVEQLIVGDLRGHIESHGHAAVPDCNVREAVLLLQHAHCKRLDGHDGALAFALRGSQDTHAAVAHDA